MDANLFLIRLQVGVLALVSRPHLDYNAERLRFLLCESQKNKTQSATMALR